MFRIVGIGVSLALFVGVMRHHHAPIAVPISIGFVLIVLLLLLQPLADVMRFLGELGRRAGVADLHLDVILRVIGIAYVASIGSAMAKDAGEQGIANVIELGGKVLILAAGLPVLSTILLSLLRLVP